MTRNLVRLGIAPGGNRSFQTKVAPLIHMVGLACALGLADCGQSNSLAEDAGACPAFLTEAQQVVTSKSGALQIAIRTLPEQPPSRGLDTVQYAVTDGTGHPVEGLVLNVVPWMPTMGHGSSIVPTIANCGNGIYTLSDVDLFMAGVWVLETTVEGKASDAASPQFQIP
jgi:hypothetical protein